MWEGVGDRTELQHIDPQSIGHNRVSFPFSWAAQPGARGPLCWVLAFSTISCHQRVWSPTGLVSKVTDFLSSPSYIIVQRKPSSCGRHNRTHSTCPRSRLYSDIPWADGPIIYIGVFPILTARPVRRSIYNRIMLFKIALKYKVNL